MSPEGRSVTRAGWAMWLAAAAVLVGLAVGNPQSSAVHGDGYYTYLWARSIVFDHDLDFGNDYEVCADPWEMASMPHGLAMNQWSPGASLFFVPILAFDVARHHPALDNADPVVANGCVGALAERAVGGSVIAGLLVLWLAFLSARRFAGDGVAAAAAAGAVLGGPVVYYATVLLSYGHAASAALGGLAVWAWLRERTRLLGKDTSEPRAHGRFAWVGMGAALGLAMLARPQNAVLVILPLWHWIETALASLRQSEGAPTRERTRALLAHVGWGVAFTAALLAIFGVQLYQWWHATGEIFLVPQGDYYLRPESPRVMNLLFSSANGLFTYCPLAYVAVGGLVALACRRRTRGIGLPLLAVLVVTTWLNACVADWWGAVGFAARRYDAMTVPFAMGMAAAIEELVALARARPRLGPAIGVGTVLFLGVTMTATSSMSVATGYRSDIGQPSTELWGRDSASFQRALWSAMGNPLAWPASLPFALRYRVHPRVWDQASMPELFFHRWLTLETQRDLTTLDLIGPHAELAIGFDPAAPTASGTYRLPVRDRARVLIPVSYPYIGSLRLDVDAAPDGAGPVDVWMALDDEVLGTFHVHDGQRQLSVPVTRPHQGIVELRMVFANGTLGLARIEIRDRDPHPSLAQARRNARLRARRVAWRIEQGLAPEGTE
jgi:hypothetical protein